MNYRELREKCARILSDNEYCDVSFELPILAELATGKKRGELFLDDEIDSFDCARLISLCTRRKEGYPLQYLLGKWDFMDLELNVGEGVLIPRQDTECVCEAALRHLEGINRPVVIDLCSGTGAIALAIKKHCPKRTVLALEKSEEAYRYLEKNIESTALEVLPIKYDVFRFDYVPEEGTFDMIVSNPPYIDRTLEGTRQKELSYEPREALYTSGGGLRFYRFIAEYFRRTLKDGGYLVFECGSDQYDRLQRILSGYGYSIVEKITDLGGNDRGIVARYYHDHDKIL
ncbi:MAG: peptide chain release factor N(5)-glutamine methyltransferase [Oscillospiraceae bacterium]|nr:peptide chain release factor N(5)-glutamine methyltransferase [Oscillospiraceae bacterium]